MITEEVYVVLVDQLQEEVKGLRGEIQLVDRKQKILKEDYERLEDRHDRLRREHYTLQKT